MSAKSKKNEPARRCPVIGCKTRLDAANTVRCTKCGKEVCKEHMYPVDHDCSAGKPTVAPQPVSAASSTATTTATAAPTTKPQLLVVVANKPRQPDVPAAPSSSAAAAAPVPTTTTSSIPPPIDLSSISMDDLYNEFSTSISKNRLLVRGDQCPRLIQAFEHPSETPSNIKIARQILSKLMSTHHESATATGTTSTSPDDAPPTIQALSSSIEREQTWDVRSRALVLLLGIAASYCATDKQTISVCDKLQSYCLNKFKDNDTVRLAAATALGECLDFRASETTKVLIQPSVELVWQRLTTCDDNPDRLRGLALVYAGLNRGIGMYTKPDAFKLLASPKSSDVLIGLITLQALAEVCGRTLEPFCMSDGAALVFSKYASGDATIKRAALEACRAMIKSCLGAIGVAEFADACERAARDANWKIKEIALLLIPDLSFSPFLEASLPGLVGELAKCVVDSKKDVSLAASQALDAVGERVTNPETKKLMPHLLHALKKPDEGTDKCLDELMEATFVNALNSTSVALIVPIVLRALREGSADLKRRGSIATGNVCSLVSDVKDVAPFYNVLKVELDKLKEHSNPAVRKAAVTAAKSLENAVGGQVKLRRSSSSNHQKTTSPRLAPHSPRVNSEGTSLDDAASVRREAIKMAKEVLRDEMKWKDDGDSNNKRHVFKFVFACLGYVATKVLQAPLLESSSATIEVLVKNELKDVLFGANNALNPAIVTVQELDALTTALFSRIRKSRSKSFDAMDTLELANDSGDGGRRRDEVLVHIPNLILAFASRVLLNKTSVTLKKHHRYGIVGNIGVGKTTFAARLAKGDIDGFPASVKTYLVLHEVVSHQQESVLAYMGGTEAARQVLSKVGFVSPDILVSALSGGWKMRLAIAKSMLADADLLILDEPTNHVDVEGVRWLADYLTHVDSTVVVVSHDYDFLGVICTDVLHIAHQRLESFQGTFAQFQVAFPDVVAALPRMKREEGQQLGNVGAATPLPQGEGDNVVPSPSPPPGPQPSQPNESSDVGSAIFELLSKSGAGDPAVSQRLKELDLPTINFPDPGKLEGISSKGKPIMTAQDVTFAYPSKPDVKVLKNVSCRISLNSRVAIRGANGQGKTTLLKLMVGELELNPNMGDTGILWKHHNLRVAYVAQHAAHHLESSLDLTPVAYLQRRYFEGRDKERSKMVTLSLTPEEKRLTEVKGEICGILSRVQRGKQLYYEIDVAGRRKPGSGGGGRESGRPGEDKVARDYRSLAQLEALNKPHVIKLVRMFDQELQYESSGMSIRPVTQVEILKHLVDFGIPDDFAERKIRWLSGGQRSRLVLAAAMWHKPHLVVLDEPTNYLDSSSLAVLTHCLRTFKGAVLAISHHHGFINALCNEAWDLEGGKLTVTVLRPKLVDVVFNKDAPPSASSTPAPTGTPSLLDEDGNVEKEQVMGEDEE